METQTSPDLEVHAEPRETFRTEDGYILDLETGEVVGLTNSIGMDGETLDQTVERYLERRALANAKMEGVRREMNLLIAGIQERFESIVKEQERKIDWLDFSFEPLARQYAMEKIAFQGKGKSLKTAWGTLGFRASRESLKVLDAAAAFRYLTDPDRRTYDPIRITFDLSAVPEETGKVGPRELAYLADALLKESPDAVKLDIMSSRVADRETLPEDCFEWSPAGAEQDFYVNHGGDK